MIKLTLKNEATRERILPAYYSENYVTLRAGEERGVSILHPVSGWSGQAGNWPARVERGGGNRCRPSQLR